MKCPKCGSKNIRILAEVCVRPFSDGCEVVGDITWDPSSDTTCQIEGCEYMGKAKEFEED